MDEAQIKAIIENCGYASRFQRRPRYSHRALRREICYVFVYLDGFQRSLGRIEAVAAMSEDALRAHIAQRVAQAAQSRAQGGQ